MHNFRLRRTFLENLVALCAATSSVNITHTHRGDTFIDLQSSNQRSGNCRMSLASFDLLVFQMERSTAAESLEQRASECHGAVTLYWRWNQVHRAVIEVYMVNYYALPRPSKQTHQPKWHINQSDARRCVDFSESDTIFC